MAAGDPRETRLAGFGRWLRQERELRGLSRREVAAATRLAPPVVEALESGDPARLPPGAYLHGSLRAYAAAVGLDADEVVLRCQEAAGEPAQVPRRPAARAAPGALAAFLAVAAALAGLIAWIASR